MQNKFFLTILFMLIVSQTAYTQVSISVKGVLKDESGKPIETDLRFTSDDGKIVKVSSDLKGHFFNPILPGNYTISIKGYIVNDNSKIVNIPTKAENHEFKHNITATKVEPGLNIGQKALFIKGKAVVNPAIKVYLQDLCEIINENRSCIELTINTNDFYSKNQKDYTKLIENREIALINLLKDLKLRDKFYEIKKLMTQNKNNKNLSDLNGSILFIKCKEIVRNVLNLRLIDANGKPIKSEIIFISEKGKEYKEESNELGQLSAKLPNDDIYYMLIKDYWANSNNAKFIFPHSENPNEIKKEIILNRITKGNVVEEMKFFDFGKSKIIATLDDFLNYFKYYNKYFQNKFSIYINSSDVFFAKNADKSIAKLLAEREKALKQYLASNENKNVISEIKTIQIKIDNKTKTGKTNLIILFD